MVEWARRPCSSTALAYTLFKQHGMKSFALFLPSRIRNKVQGKGTVCYVASTSRC